MYKKRKSDRSLWGETPFKYAFTIGEQSFYGGSYGLLNPEKWDFSIQCQEWKYATVKWRKNGIILPWENYKAPDLSRLDWEDLVYSLPKGNIAVCCFGGHGRTGTALAIIYGLLSNDGADPVKKIRHLYRPESCESTEQVRYVQNITGRDCQAKASIQLLEGWPCY